MRSIFRTILPLLVFSACSQEQHMTRRALKRRDDVMALAKKFFQHYSQQTYLTPANLDTLQFISDDDFGLLRDKLKCSSVEIFRAGVTADPPVDSLVIFSRFNLFGMERGLMVDVRQFPRDSIPPPKGVSRHWRVGTGIYYFEHEIPFS